MMRQCVVFSKADGQAFRTEEQKTLAALHLLTLLAAVIDEMQTALDHPEKELVELTRLLRAIHTLPLTGPDLIAEVMAMAERMGIHAALARSVAVPVPAGNGMVH